MLRAPLCTLHEFTRAHERAREHVRAQYGVCERVYVLPLGEIAGREMGESRASSLATLLSPAILMHDWASTLQMIYQESAHRNMSVYAILFQSCTTYAEVCQLFVQNAQMLSHKHRNTNTPSHGSKSVHATSFKP